MLGGCSFDYPERAGGVNVAPSLKPARSNSAPIRQLGDDRGHRALLGAPLTLWVSDVSLRTRTQTNAKELAGDHIGSNAVSADALQ